MVSCVADYNCNSLSDTLAATADCVRYVGCCALYCSQEHPLGPWGESTLKCTRPKPLKKAAPHPFIAPTNRTPEIRARFIHASSSCRLKYKLSFPTEYIQAYTAEIRKRHCTSFNALPCLKLAHKPITLPFLNASRTVSIPSSAGFQQTVPYTSKKCQGVSAVKLPMLKLVNFSETTGVSNLPHCTLHTRSYQNNYHEEASSKTKHFYQEEKKKKKYTIPIATAQRCSVVDLNEERFKSKGLVIRARRLACKKDFDNKLRDENE